MCLDIPDPANGDILFQPDNSAPFDLNTEAMYICNTGYVPVGGDLFQVCIPNHDFDIGYWNGTAPSCERELDKV